MRKSLNHKGMTLLELIIAMAISFIVILMIISFMSGASRMFQKTNHQVTLQMEAQNVINQIADLAMEAKSITKSSTSERYQITGYDNPGYALIYDNTKQELFLVSLNPPELFVTPGSLVTPDPLVTPSPSITPVTLETAVATPENNLLAEYITDFKLETVIGDGSLWNITIKLELGKDEYEVTKKVHLRNYATPTP